MRVNEIVECKTHFLNILKVSWKCNESNENENKKVLENLCIEVKPILVERLKWKKHNYFSLIDKICEVKAISWI